MTVPALTLPREAIPRLENGDRLTCPEFERRYEAMPDAQKIELIEGVVYMPSPVRIQHHDVAAMLREDLPAIVAQLQPGLQTTEYAAFRQRLTA